MDPVLPDTDEVITCDMLKGWDTARCDWMQHHYGIQLLPGGPHHELSVLHPSVGGKQYHVKLCTPALWYAQGWKR